MELVSRAYEAWAQGDEDGLFTLIHPDIEWHPPPQAPEPGPFRGHDAIREGIFSYLESFDEFRPEPREIVPGAGVGQVLALVTTHTRGKGSGAEVSVEVAHLIEVRDAMIARFQVFMDRAEARRAAGLT